MRSPCQIPLQQDGSLILLPIALEKDRRQDTYTNDFRGIPPLTHRRLSHIVVFDREPKIGQLLAELAVARFLIEKASDQLDLSVRIFVLLSQCKLVTQGKNGGSVTNQQRYRKQN